MITPRHVNHEAYAPAPLLTRKMFVSVGAMREETSWLYRLRLRVSSEPCFREAKNVSLLCLSGMLPLLGFHQPCCQETGHWRVICSGAVHDVPVSGAWPEDSFVCPFYSIVILVRWLVSDPLSWVVGKKTEDPLRESRIPGRNDGELTLLLYSVVPPDCM